MKARKARASASNVHQGGSANLPMVMPAGIPSYLRHEREAATAAGLEGRTYKRDQPRTSPKKMGKVRTDLQWGVVSKMAVRSVRWVVRVRVKQKVEGEAIDNGGGGGEGHMVGMELRATDSSRFI